MINPETTWEPDAIRALIERVDEEHQEICDSVDMLPSDLRTPATDAARALTVLLAALEFERAKVANLERFFAELAGEQSVTADWIEHNGCPDWLTADAPLVPMVRLRAAEAALHEARDDALAAAAIRAMKGGA